MQVVLQKEHQHVIDIEFNQMEAYLLKYLKLPNRNLYVHAMYRIPLVKELLLELRKLYRKLDFDVDMFSGIFVKNIFTVSKLGEPLIIVESEELAKFERHINYIKSRELG